MSVAEACTAMKRKKKEATFGTPEGSTQGTNRLNFPVLSPHLRGQNARMHFKTINNAAPYAGLSYRSNTQPCISLFRSNTQPCIVYLDQTPSSSAMAATSSFLKPRSLTFGACLRPRSSIYDKTARGLLYAVKLTNTPKTVW